MTTPLKVHGVDISHHQRGLRIGWETLKREGVQWMYHKATEGVSFRDTAYVMRREQADAAGMPFGAYHFARPNIDDARAEARFFIDVADPHVGDLRPCLDLETRAFVSGQALVDWADAFCDEVQRLTKAVPVVYTPYTLSESLEDRAIFWVPRYNNDNERPFRDWDIWQFSNGVYGVPNSVPGLGHVDLNHSPKVTLQALQFPSTDQPPPSRGRRVDSAMAALQKAEGREGSRRGRLINKATEILNSIKPK